jgi:hypothetical protein
MWFTWYIIRVYGRLLNVQDVKIPTRLCYVVHTCRNLLDLRSSHGHQLWGQNRCTEQSGNKSIKWRTMHILFCWIIQVSGADEHVVWSVWWWRVAVFQLLTYCGHATALFEMSDWAKLLYYFTNMTAKHNKFVVFDVHIGKIVITQRYGRY